MAQKNSMLYNRKLFSLIVVFVGITMTIDTLIANYFYEVFNTDSVMRGFLEFPRELPGVVQMLLIAALGFIGNTKKAMISQLLAAIGFFVLGFGTPTFAVMCIFLFTFSLGVHLYMPLHDAISVDMAEEGKSGEFLGKMNSLKIGSTMAMTILAYLGFHFKFFTFEAPIIPFVIFGFAALLAAIGLCILSNQKEMKAIDEKYTSVSQKKFKIYFRKEYKYYYILQTLNGVQKQIMLVFGPWVLIDLLDAQADTVILLNIIAFGLSIFVLKYIGILADKLGIRKMMFADAFSFIIVYGLYGVLCGALVNGTIKTPIVGIVLAGIMFVCDRISMNFGMVRTLYLKNIAVEGDNIVDTISLGISMDHVVAITCAMLSGVVWKMVGPQYVFYLTACLSIVNVIIAGKVKINGEK